jgi:hypothetical protein
MEGHLQKFPFRSGLTKNMVTKGNSCF